MAFVSLYRKYRSQSFDELRGQDHVVKTLASGIRQGRIAHSYLFTGPRGTGKTSTARLLAKALCCEKGPTPTPCNECDICRSITEGSCLDVIEMDAASESGVDDIRESIVSAMSYTPSQAKFKVYIIDEVHDLSAKAFDALLKTIEEPPEHVIFILATTEFAKVPPTIRSRCQKYEFHRGSMQDLVAILSKVSEAEGMKAEPAALTAIARIADGGYRDALTLLEQAILTSEEGSITLAQVYDQLGLISDDAADALLTALSQGDVAALTKTYDELIRLGRDTRAIVESLLYRTADLTRALLHVDDTVEVTVSAAAHAVGTAIGQAKLIRLRGELAELHRELHSITLPRLWLEAELVRLSQSEAHPAKEHRADSKPKEAPSQAPGAAKDTPRPREEAKAVAQVPAAAPTGSNWEQLLRKVTADSKNMGIKLADVRADFSDGVLTLVFPGNLSKEWFTNDDRKSAFFRERAEQVYGKGTRIVYDVKKAVREESRAVELEYQGKALQEEITQALKESIE